jgi:ATP-dependent Clp protease ATP-binding subunit ClpA
MSATMSTDKNNAEGGFFALYTRHSRRTIVLAQEEALSIDHRSIDTEHLLLGLLRVEDGVAYNALSALGIALEDARRRVVEIAGRNVGREGLEPSSTGQLPFTPRMKEVLRQAVLEARWLEHDRHIGTEHLLLGLSGQYDGVAARVLNEQGMTPGTIRKEIMKKIGRGYLREGQTGPSGKTIEAWAPGKRRGGKHGQWGTRPVYVHPRGGGRQRYHRKLRVWHPGDHPLLCLAHRPVYRPGQI